AKRSAQKGDEEGNVFDACDHQRAFEHRDRQIAAALDHVDSSEAEGSLHAAVRVLARLRDLDRFLRGGQGVAELAPFRLGQGEPRASPYGWKGRHAEVFVNEISLKGRSHLSVEYRRHHVVVQRVWR